MRERPQDSQRPRHRLALGTCLADMVGSVSSWQLLPPILSCSVRSAVGCHKEISAGDGKVQYLVSRVTFPQITDQASRSDDIGHSLTIADGNHQDVRSGNI